MKKELTILSILISLFLGQVQSQNIFICDSIETVEIPDTITSLLYSKFDSTLIIGCCAYFNKNDSTYHITHLYSDSIKLKTVISLDRYIFNTYQNITYKHLPINIYKDCVEKVINDNGGDLINMKFSLVTTYEDFSYYRFTFSKDTLVNHEGENHKVTESSEYLFDINGNIIDLHDLGIY